MSPRSIVGQSNDQSTCHMLRLSHSLIASNTPSSQLFVLDHRFRSSLISHRIIVPLLSLCNPCEHAFFFGF